MPRVSLASPPRAESWKAVSCFLEFHHNPKRDLHAKRQEKHAGTIEPPNSLC
jgi:hypothetical protein